MLLLENDWNHCDYLMSASTLTSSREPDGWGDAAPQPKLRRTDLKCSTVDCNIEAAAPCIENNAKMSETDSKGWTVLIYYARLDGNSTQTAQFLAQEGVDVNQCDNDGWTPLHHAIATGNTKACQLLVKKGADVNLVNKLGETALMFCAKHSNVEAATLLIESGADVNQENRDGWTPLTYCARYCGSAQIAKLLIYHWAKVNQPDRLGRPPLTHCALAGGKLVAEALVCNGAGVTVRQRENYSAYRQASASESEFNAVI